MTHNRRSIQMKGWDYRSVAYYFITICTYQRECLFDDPILQDIAANAWAYIPNQDHARHVVMDEWVVMPNHLHGVLHITIDPDIPLPDSDGARGPASGSIGAIVSNYKMLVTRRVKHQLKVAGTNRRVWQRGYYERIIRTERELNAVRQYIQNNPLRWTEDRDNLDSMLVEMRYVEKG